MVKISWIGLSILWSKLVEVVISRKGTFNIQYFLDSNPPFLGLKSSVLSINYFTKL